MCLAHGGILARGDVYAKSEGKERVRVRSVRTARLAAIAWPRKGKLAARWRGAKKYISNTRPLCAREPCGHESVDHGEQRWRDAEGAAADRHHHHAP